MSDIAMLVAEEYERREKNSRKDGEEIELFSSVAVLLAKIKRIDGFDWIKERLGQGSLMEMIKWVPDPKSQIGLAAINGLFSA